LYEFDPVSFGFRRMPREFNDYWGNGEKWYKVTEKSDSAFWFVVCRRVVSIGNDDRWKIQSAAATNDASGRETTSDHVVFVGCITTQQFAEALLAHVMGTTINEGTVKHGRRRLESPFLEYA